MWGPPGAGKTMVVRWGRWRVQPTEDRPHPVAPPRAARVLRQGGGRHARGPELMPVPWPRTAIEAKTKCPVLWFCGRQPDLGPDDGCEAWPGAVGGVVIAASISALTTMVCRVAGFGHFGRRGRACHRFSYRSIR